MDNVVNTNDIDIDYMLIYKDKDNILSDIGFEDEYDTLTCEAIIDNLEDELVKQLKEGNTVSIPFIGTIEKNWYKSAIRDNYKDFEEYKNTHSKEDYQRYFKAKCEEFKKNHKDKEDKIKRMNKFKSKLLPKYINLCKDKSVVYANAWIAMLYRLEVVEFDADIEDIYERFGR